MSGFADSIMSEFSKEGEAAGQAFADGMQRGVDSGSSRASGILSGLGRVAAGVAGVATAGFAALSGAVTAIGSQALSSYADYEQLAGGVSKLFGTAGMELDEYAASVGQSVDQARGKYGELEQAQSLMMANAKNAFKSAGMSANQYMEQATSFSASLISSLGGDTVRAAQFADLAMTSMSDNVNTFGTSMEDVQNAFQGFSKQNYTMLDNLKLGYGGTKKEMQRLIDDANKLPGVLKEGNDLSIDSYSDVVEAIARVQEAQNIAGTTAREAEKTISGSIGMAKAAWQNFLIGLGSDDADFSQLTNSLLESIGFVAQNVGPRVATIGHSIIEAFPKVLSSFGTVLAPVVVEALSTAWGIASNALGELGVSIPGIDAQQLLGGFQEIVGYVSGTLLPALAPIGDAFANLASTVGPMVLPLAQQLATAFGGLAPVLSSVAAGVVDVATQILAFVIPVATQIVEFVSANMPAIQAIVSWTMTAISNVIGAALSVISAIWNAVWPVLQAVLSVVLAAMQALMTGDMSALQGIIDSALSAIQSVWNSAWSAVRQFLSDAWEGIKSGVSDGVDAAYNAVTQIKDRILGFFSGAGSWLVDSGRAILEGLKDGIMGAIGSVTSAVSDAVGRVRSYFPFSPAKEGPFSGHGYTTYSGAALMGGFAEGISAHAGLVTAAAEDALGGVGSLMDAGVSAAYSVTAAPATYGYREREPIDYGRLADVLAERLDGMYVLLDGDRTVGELARASMRRAEMMPLG